MAHIHPASAFLASVEHQRAIIESSRAMRINPESAFASSVRSRAHQAKGGADRTEADRKEAERILDGFKP